MQKIDRLIEAQEHMDYYGRVIGDEVTGTIVGEEEKINFPNSDYPFTDHANAAVVFIAKVIEVDNREVPYAIEVRRDGECRWYRFKVKSCLSVNRETHVLVDDYARDYAEKEAARSAYERDKLKE